MPSGRTNNFPESGRGLGHVSRTILAVRSAILATAWLLVICRRRRRNEILRLSVNSGRSGAVNSHTVYYIFFCNWRGRQKQDKNSNNST